MVRNKVLCCGWHSLISVVQYNLLPCSDRMTPKHPHVHAHAHTHTHRGARNMAAQPETTSPRCPGSSKWPCDEVPETGTWVEVLCANSESQLWKGAACPSHGLKCRCGNEDEGNKTEGSWVTLWSSATYLPGTATYIWTVTCRRNKPPHLSLCMFQCLQCLCDSSLAYTLTNACDFLLPQLCAKNPEAIRACTNLKSRRGKKIIAKLHNSQQYLSAKITSSPRRGWNKPHPHEGVLHRVEQRPQNLAPSFP